jgi:hypothetical protein
MSSIRGPAMSEIPNQDSHYIIYRKRNYKIVGRVVRCFKDQKCLSDIQILLHVNEFRDRNASMLPCFYTFTCPSSLT